MISNAVAWLLLLLVLVGLVLGWIRRHNSPAYRYRDVITDKKPEAKYYPVDKRAEFTWEQKKRIADRDGWKCQYKKCGVKVLLKPKTFWGRVIYAASYLPGLGWLYKDRLMEIDHLLFAWLNGPATEENGRVLCRKHNRRRGGMPDRDFFEELQIKGEKVYLPKGYKY